MRKDGYQLGMFKYFMLRNMTSSAGFTVKTEKSGVRHEVYKQHVLHVTL